MRDSLWSSPVVGGVLACVWVSPPHRTIQGTRYQRPFLVGCRLYDWQALGWL